MPSQLRLYDFRVSRVPSVVGICREDIQALAAVANTAQQRLLYCEEAGDEGWYGTFAEMVFTVDPTRSFITTPRQVARIEAMTLCDRPIAIENQFYEYLQFGNGTLPRNCRIDRWCQVPRTYSRNNVPLFVDPPKAPFMVRAYMTNGGDVGKRALVGGLDSNGNPIYSQDGLNRVVGQFASFDTPFVTWPMSFNEIKSVQKDVTLGSIRFVSVDPTTGEETTILTMEPGEQTASYRRYFTTPVPRNCCNQATGTLTVRAIVKLEPIPVAQDPDFFLIQNLEALIEECASVHYRGIDATSSKTMAQEAHKQAVKLLNGELAHYLGKDSPAVEFAPFGSAHLNKVMAGMI